MRVSIISGPSFVEEALLGIGLSYGLTSAIDDMDYFKHSRARERLVDVSMELAKKEGGHNKFLETIMLTLDITAPRFWWQEFDTYRVGVTKQSESTMHTIAKRSFVREDFEIGLSTVMLEELNRIRTEYLTAEDTEREWKFHLLKNYLPEGYLQRRIVSLNVKSLKNMYTQRKNHRLRQWYTFFHNIDVDLMTKEYGMLVSKYIFN